MTAADTTSSAIATEHSAAETIRTWGIVALVAFLVSLIAYAGFMTAGGVWFTISDASGLLLAGSMIPVMIAFDAPLRYKHGTTSRIARWIGVTGMVVAGVGSIVLLTSEVSHEFVPAGGGLGMQFVGFGLEGVWFLMIGRMASDGAIFSRRFVWAAYAAGVGFVVGALGGPLGPDNPIVMAAATTSLVAFIVWALLTRRELSSA